MPLNPKDADLLNAKRSIITNANVTGVAPKIVAAQTDNVQSAQEDLNASNAAILEQVRLKELEAATQARILAEAEASRIRNLEAQNQTALAEETAAQQRLITQQVATEQAQVAKQAADAQRLAIEKATQAQTEALTAPAGDQERLYVVAESARQSAVQVTLDAVSKAKAAQVAADQAYQAYLESVDASADAETQRQAQIIADIAVAEQRKAEIQTAMQVEAQLQGRQLSSTEQTYADIISYQARLDAVVAQANADVAAATAKASAVVKTAESLTASLFTDATTASLRAATAATEAVAATVEAERVTEVASKRKITAQKEFDDASSAVLKVADARDIIDTQQKIDYAVQAELHKTDKETSDSRISANETANRELARLNAIASTDKLKAEQKRQAKIVQDIAVKVEDYKKSEQERQAKLKQIQNVVDHPSNPSPGTLPEPVRLRFVINLTLLVLPASIHRPIVFNIAITPQVPVFDTGLTTEISTIKINDIPLSLESAFTVEIDRLLYGKVENFFDNERQLKTLLNFGTDYQPLILNWKLNLFDDTGQGLTLKLYKPLPPEVELQTSVFISQELAYPTIEKIYIIDAPAPAPNVYLRYPNKRIKLAGRTGGIVNNVTMNTLLSSGAYDIVKPQDRVMDEWFTTNLEGVELNIDYSNFRNFVFYGSAEKHLEAFKNKLKLIENYDSSIVYSSASLALISSESAGSTSFTSSYAYTSLYTLAEDRQDIIRSFDGYERFLYYESGSEMSGSFTREVDRDEFDAFYYLPDATWPKISGVVAPIASASVWYTSVSDIARDYDKWNVNRLVSNLPEYIQNDAASEEYLRFFDLVGHIFDIVKLYIDHMADVYDRNSDPSQGLSSDLVWDIANAFGINLPNQYAIENILDYTLGVSKSSKVYKQSATETWRRFLHNQIFLMKSKGTKTALSALLNVYGVLPTTIQIRESSTPSYFYASQSFETYEEQTNALEFVAPSASYITIPWSSSAANAPVTIQMRFNTYGSSQTQILFNADNKWAAVLSPTGSSYKVALMSGSTVAATSSAWPLGSGDYYSLMIMSGSSGVKMYLKRADDDGDIIVSDVATAIGPISASWNAPTNLYLGGSGSYFAGSGYRGLTGTVDEFRIWGEATTEVGYTNWVKYPGMYNGNTTTSTRDKLWVRLSFNKPNNLGEPGTQSFVSNDSPYQRLLTAPVYMAHFSASDFTHMAVYPYNVVVYNRTVQRFSPTGGGSQFDTNMITIEDAPILQYLSGSGTAIPVLHKDSSIISIADKKDRKKSNNAVGFYFSPTEAINDSIIRSVGNIDLNDYIADPKYLSVDRYKELDVLNQMYWADYAYPPKSIYPDTTNSFISFVQNLLAPLFEQARQLVPARVKLIAGVVIEPHILERNKIAWKPIIKEESDLDVVEHPTTNPAVEAASEDNDALFDMTIGEVIAEMEDKDSIFDMNQGELISEVDDNNGLITVDIWELDSAYTSYEDTLNVYVDYFETLNAVTLDYDALYDIHQIREDAVRIYGETPYVNPYEPIYGAACDLENDIGATNYFDNLAGLVGGKKYTYIRTKEVVISDKGTWASGVTYRKNDLVIQPYTVTDSQYDIGNGKEFYAIMDNFISNIPPQGEPSRWRRVAYVAKEEMDIKKAVLIGGVLSLVPTSSALTPIQGYMPQHYRYFQPNYTAFRRSRYLGCVQTDITTIDGIPVVEVLLSSADTLVVSTTSEPIAGNSNLTGPTFLNVK